MEDLSGSEYASVQVVHLLKPIRLSPAGAAVAGWVSHPLSNSASAHEISGPAFFAPGPAGFRAGEGLRSWGKRAWNGEEQRKDQPHAVRVSQREARSRRIDSDFREGRNSSSSRNGC